MASKGLDFKVSIYNGKKDVTGKNVISIRGALDRIKNGKSKDAIIALRELSNKDEQDLIKDKLPSVTFSGRFSYRNQESVLECSDIICLDFDDIDLDDKISFFKKWEYTLAFWISPRGKGLKVLIKVSDGRKHKDHFNSLIKDFPDCDKSTKDISRLCYESYDPNLFLNENSLVYTKCITEEVVYKNIVTNTDKQATFKNLMTWLEKKNDIFQSGNRNQYIFNLASAMCRYGILEEETISLIKNEFLSRDSTFTSKEASDAIRSAYKISAKHWNTAEFSKEELVTKSTKYVIDPRVLNEGFDPTDVIFGMDVVEGGLDIYRNGYRSAETTYIPMMDVHFKWKKKELVVLSGIGNYGKSSLLNEMMVIKSVNDGTKWAIFSPENNPASEYYHDLTEILLGSPCDASYRNRPSEEKYLEAWRFISDHFFYIYPETISPSPEYIKTKFLELIITKKVEGCVIDPFNQLTNDYAKKGNRVDKYLETFLSDCTRFAQQNDVYFLIVAHPNGSMEKGSDGNYKCPDVFDLADGAMWNNKCDCILFYHRPFAQTLPNDPTCEFHAKKIRRQKIVGIKGTFTFMLDRGKRRFYYDGFNPLDGNRFEDKGFRKFIPSTEEILPKHFPNRNITEPINNSDNDCPF